MLCLAGGGQQADQEEWQDQAAGQEFALRGDLGTPHDRDVDPDAVLVARLRAGTVRFDGGVPESVREIARRTADWSPAQALAAFGTGQAVVGGVDDAPVVPVGFGGHHFGERLLLVPVPVLAGIDAPGSQERRPLFFDDRVHQGAAGVAGGRAAVLVVAALRAASQRCADCRSGHGPKPIPRKIAGPPKSAGVTLTQPAGIPRISRSANPGRSVKGRPLYTS